MFKFEEIKQIQIEITGRCQASCPMCPRNIHGGIENPSLPINDWTLDNFITIFSSEVLSQIKEISFCGNFGDAILNNDLISMCNYVTSHAPDVRIVIHTNGSARSKSWWIKLAQTLPNNHSIVFALDGLADTQHLYRVGTNFTKIIENAKTFIDAGGKATWAYIRFKHNEHQVNQAKTMANELGFSNFILKNSRRFSRPFPVVDKTGKILYTLEQPTDGVIEFVGRKHVENHQNWIDADKINCQAQAEKSLYIDSTFLLSPCCMIGAFMYSNYDPEILKKYNLYEEDSVNEEAVKVQQQVLQFPKFNMLTLKLKDVVESDHWQTIWQKRWREKTSSPCIIMCGPNSPFIRTQDQKIKNA